MPNLLPDWFAWIRPAGRLIWSSGLLLIGIGFVVALIKPPLLKRPFADRVGYAGPGRDTVDRRWQAIEQGVVPPSVPACARP